MKPIIIIPAYNPDHKLIDLIEKLQLYSFLPQGKNVQIPRRGFVKSPQGSSWQALQYRVIDTNMR